MDSMDTTDRAAIKDEIASGNAILGVELGSTRIKAVLIDRIGTLLASGDFEWENRWENGIWTYRPEDIWAGLQAAYRALAEGVEREYGMQITKLGAIGVSAMMHGYLPLDAKGKQLVPFRTWRNTTTSEASEALTEEFKFAIPQRWSIAHLYQAILNGETHVNNIAYLTTLAGYVHWRLTDRSCLGVGDASGMLPIDPETGNFRADMIARFDELASSRGFSKKLADILPHVLQAGDDAGTLTEEGARLLDPSGSLQAGVPFCPPEGDAETGMTATNSVAKRTGNISAGTSIFLMAVLEKPLTDIYPEIDIVTTPTGLPVAMVHCNNGTSDLDAWMRIFSETAEAMGGNAEKSHIYNTLYAKALEGDADGGGLTAVSYFSGEPITGFEEGRPLFLRKPDSSFTLANFMRALLFSSMATLRIGMDILTEKEKISLDRMFGHGGFFKAADVGQRMLASALNVPISVMKSAGEGGAWGIALLAAYRIDRRADETLESYLEDRIFAGQTGSTVSPDADDIEGFRRYMERYRKALEVERAALSV
jgi:sugar (pentulose or hexulose) kinase